MRVEPWISFHGEGPRAYGHEALEVWPKTPRTRVSWDEAMEFALFRQTSGASGSHCRPKSQPSGTGSQASPSQLTLRLHFQAIPAMPDGAQITPVTPAMPATEHRPRATGAIRCAHLLRAMRIPPALGPGDVSVVQSQAAGSTGDESPVY